MTETSEHSKSSHEISPIQGYRLDDLCTILASRPKGVSGPERGDAENVMNDVRVLSNLDIDIARWEHADVVVSGVCLTIDKLVDREDISKNDLSPNLHKEIAEKINRLAMAANFPDTKQGLSGLQRLILNIKLEDAEYYLSEEFVYELQDIAKDVPDLEFEIGNFFSVRELLRKVTYERDALDAAREAVRKSTEICQDRQAYLVGLLGREPDSKFVRALTNSTVLTIATRFSESVDQVVANSANHFEKFVYEYPLLAELDSGMILGLLLRSNTATGAQSANKVCRGIETMLERALQAGEDKLTMTTIIRMTHGDVNRYEEALLNAEKLRTLRARTSNSNGEATQRARRTAARNTLPLHAFAALKEDRAYGNVLIAIDEVAFETNNQEVLEVFDEVDKIRTAVKSFSKNLPRISEHGDEYASSIAAAINKRVSELLSPLPYLVRGQECKGSVYHGDKFFEEASLTDYHEVLDALRLVRFATEVIAQGQMGEFSETTINPLDGAGRFVSDSAPLAIVVRPEEIDGGEARIAWTVMITPEEQEKLLGRRITDKPTKITLRLDFERKTGQISLDFGGMLAFVKEQQPLNYMIAEAITVGSQVAGRDLGVAPENSDYHVREVFGNNLANVDEFRRYVTSLMYQLYISSHELSARDFDRAA